MSTTSPLATMVQRFSEWARKAGLQYQGKRDVFASAGYLRSGTEHFDDYWSLFVRNEIAARIVELPVGTTWKVPPAIVEPDRPGGTKFTKAFEQLAQRVGLWEAFAKVDTLAGVGRYAVLLFGTSGSTDQTLLRPATGPQGLLYLAPYAECDAEIETYVIDVGSERFGTPELYRLRAGGEKNLSAATLRVHSSRVIHVAEKTLRDRVYGQPRLQRALNRLFDLDKIAASTGESYWQAVARILSIKLDPQAAITEQQLDELTDQAAEMVHDLRRQFIAQGAEMSWLPAQVSPVKDVGDFYFQLISVACGIPRRILFGNETGELASSTDEATYFGMIKERQQHYAEPKLLRPFIDRMLEWRVLPPPETGTYVVQWEPLFELTELEQADANLKRAQAAAALTPMGGDPLDLVEIDEDRNVWLVQKKPGPVVPPEPTPLPPEVHP